MALTVTGIDSSGRVTTGTAAAVVGGILVPRESAGIGDLVYKLTSVFSDKAANNTPSNFRVVARGTATASTITVGGTSYTLYGGIYGFVNGEAMIIGPAEKGGARWCSSDSSSLGPTHSRGPIMRNGKSHTYVQMNTSKNAGYITGGSSQPSDGLLTSAYQATSLTESTFLTSANAETLSRFGSWKEYIRQTLRVNGAPGTPFGMTSTGVKVHEFGRWMGKQAYAAGLSSYPAFQSCYNHNEGGGIWWLPSMFELGELMIDEHLDKVNQNSASIFTAIDKGSYRWSCVRLSTGYAWYYSNSGMSRDYYGFSYTFAVRPVTLLKLV